MNFLTEFYAHRKYQVSVSLFYFTVVSPLNRGHLLWKHNFVIHYKITVTKKSVNFKFNSLLSDKGPS